MPMSMRRSRITGGLLLSACLMGVMAWSIPALGSSMAPGHVPASIGYPSRAILTRVETWNSRCDPLGCVITSFGGPSLTTSPAVGRVDVTFTVTLDLRTTVTDYGAFYATIGTFAGKPQRRMPPGTLFVMSPSHKVLTTTTLVWAMSRLPARGVTYYFFLTAVPRDGNHDGSANIVGGHLTMVAEQSQA
jgi:hypothetical protein